MGAAPAPVIASADEALAMVHAGLTYLATADATAMGAAERAGCLRGLEEADAVATAARTSVLGAFGAGQDYTEDGDYSPFTWLVHRTRVTRGTAADHTGWIKRGAGHPAVMAALASRQVSKSYAREICRWTDKLPEDSRAAADEILLGAAAAGLELADLAGLAAEMYERSRQDKPDTDPGGSDDGAGDEGAGFDDRSVTLATTFGGAGIIRGNLTPECAAFVETVLDSLSAPTGADDDRSGEQRYHDALQEAMRRLVAGGLVPQRSGQPLRVWAYISLADLMQLPGSAELVREWMSQLAVRWTGHRAAATENGGHQGLWLDGDAARGIACGAPVAPVVVGDVNPAAFGDLIRLCAQLDKLLHDPASDQLTDRQPGEDRDPADAGNGSLSPALAGSHVPADPDPPPTPTRPVCLPHSAAAGRGSPWSRPSSARRSSCCLAPAAWPASCAADSLASASAAPACPWTSGTPGPSRPGSATPPGSAAGTASGPGAAASPPPPARSTTSSTRPTAARPASPAASCSARITTR
jgi:uncharacterized protein DUF222